MSKHKQSNGPLLLDLAGKRGRYFRAVVTGMLKTRNGQMTKQRNGTQDTSQSCKIAVSLKSLFVAEFIL